MQILCITSKIRHRIIAIIMLIKHDLLNNDQSIEVPHFGLVTSMIIRESFQIGVTKQ